MFDVFQLTFMRYALIGGLLIGAACAYVGTYLILRRIIFVGIALSEVAACGVILGLVLGVYPNLVAALITILAILIFWLPLFASWLLMTAEGPTISAAINRLPNEVIMLAAQGIVISLAVTIESPIINLLATSTALVKDRASYLLVRRFTPKGEFVSGFGHPDFPRNARMRGLAIDRTAEHVYVANTEENKVMKFDFAGSSTILTGIPRRRPSSDTSLLTASLSVAPMTRAAPLRSSRRNFLSAISTPRLRSPRRAATGRSPTTPTEAPHSRRVRALRAATSPAPTTRHFRSRMSR